MRIFSLPFFLLFLAGCNCSQQDNKSIINKTSGIIDYRKANYHFFLGQTVDSIQQVIDIQHDYMAGDGIAEDNLGIGHYMYLGESLTKPDGDLPALFFKTDHGKLFQFTCSIIGSNAQNDLEDFLNTLAPRFSSLSPENMEILRNTYQLNLSKPGFIEKFTLDTKGRKYDVFFRYVKQLEE